MHDGKTLADLLHEAAHRFRKKEALLYEGRNLTYRELDEASNKVANALADLGLEKGDRVALMLPNIPEFVTSFFGIQKLGAVAVPFNTLYKGREIIHILNDCGARALITLTHFSSFINEIRAQTPDLDFVLVTGQRTLVFVEPGATVSAQMVVEQAFFRSADDAFRKAGEALEDTLRQLGVKDVRYQHRGGLRVRGRKIATIVIQTIENLYLINALVFLGPMDTEAFFKVIWVPPEIKDKTLEPLTSVSEETGRPAEHAAFREALGNAYRERLGLTFETGVLQRDERFGYEKARALAYRT